MSAESSRNAAELQAAIQSELSGLLGPWNITLEMAQRIIDRIEARRSTGPPCNPSARADHWHRAGCDGSCWLARRPTETQGDS